MQKKTVKENIVVEPAFQILETVIVNKQWASVVVNAQTFPILKEACAQHWYKCKPVLCRF